MVEDGTVSEEDEAAECKENSQKEKPKVCQRLFTHLQEIEITIFSFRFHVCLSFLVSEIKDQTRQRALRHRHLL